ncbi:MULTISPECIES: SdpI family protein [unclassified Treponema]|uniref:SdpI family protein n=1 Tax=unclassified Treponema TaxID=2638727 RepID=UPI0020A5B953|nr:MULTISPECIES: SdpI family protein [unclassified Treponema]UTC67300.1 SdpI family protein [Treponema sp. OMZ 789]UTC70028.1 SdpI family protein [Treponema sp. OMZ 790]UTC72744.1 SdpI family protein [Treponema sp. OMZ 791]
MRKKILYMIITLLSFSPSIYYIINIGNENIKNYDLYILPILIIIFSIVMEIAVNTLSNNSKLPKKLYLPIVLSTPLLFAIAQSSKYIFKDSNSSGIEKYIHILASMIIIIIGNYLPKTKPSRFVGLKFFWLLDKPVVWYKTHRLAGFLWIITGILLLSFGVSAKWEYLIIYFSLLYVIPLIYSLLLLNKERRLYE